MTRVLLVPAAGRGTRLRSPLPKLLTPIAGTAMIDHVLARHRPYCMAAIVVVGPDHRARVEAHVASAPWPVTCVEQPDATGMLDALLVARAAVSALEPDRVWISWCDQVAISAATAERLAELDARIDPGTIAFPTSTHPAPYIHFDRDARDRIVAVRQRREGDVMPERGESDCGLFSLPARTFDEALPAYAATAAQGTGTRERNFLPFLPLMAMRGGVATFPVDPIEAVGINTPEDLATIERHLEAAPRAGA